MRDALKMYTKSPKQPQVFSIDFNSPFYQSVPECTVSESAESEPKAEFLEPKGAMEGGIMVNFQPSAAGEYPGRLVMRSNLKHAYTTFILQ